MERELQKFLKGNELRIISESFEWLGTPYAFGMQNKGEGTDCSGMVMVIYNDIAGCKLPRNSAQQAEYCLGLETDDKVKAGDLVFFITNSGDKINHVGIMIDETQFIHASSKGVVISSMETSYYQTHFRSFGRVPCLGD